MMRHIFNLLSGMSLVLFTATVLFWTDSYWYHEYVHYSRGHSFITLDSGWGQWRAEWTMRFPWQIWQAGLEGRHETLNSWAIGSNYVLHDCSALFGGFGWGRVNCAARSEKDGYFAPFQTFCVAGHEAPLAGIFAVVPIAWILKRYHRKHLTKSGRCLVCGYDLRATPHRCPECGASPAKAN